MKKKTILIIEDNIYLSKILFEIFCREYQIHIKENGFDALVFLERGNIPDLIISDLKMPKLDGHEFLSIIKNSNYFNNIPLLVLSGIQDSKDRIKCLKKGADDFMLKPFNPEELKIRVLRLFKRKKVLHK